MGFSPSSFTRHTHRSSALKLLPDAALSLASSLPSDEQEVLFFLVDFPTRVYDIPAMTSPRDRGRSVWKPWRSSAIDAVKLGSAARQRSYVYPSMAAGVHQPTFGCDCFECYSKFWSRWNSSPRRDVIDHVLELLDQHVVEGQFGWRAALSPQNLMSNEGKEKRGKVEAVEIALSGKEGTGSRRGKLSWKNRGRRERISSAKIKLQTVSGGTISEDLVGLIDAKDLSAGEGDGQKLLTLLKPDTFIPQAGEVSFDANPSSHGPDTKNRSKQRGGKRKSKQVAPLDCHSIQAEMQEEEGQITSERAIVGASSAALRAENSSLRGRGFLGRVFPDALGGVATRLWEFVSLKLRSQTTDFY